MGTSLFTRLAAVVLLMVLSASALTIALNYAKFRQVMTLQERSLYAFVATDLARSIEGSLNLGLPLATLQTTQRLIDAKHEEDRAILGVTVFDARGMDIFDTERFRIGSAVPPALLPPAGAASWRIGRAGVLGVGERIFNSFGQSAGGVVVRYDPDRLDAVMLSVLLVMARSGVYVLCAATVIALVAVWLATRSTRRWFVDSTARLESSIHEPVGQALDPAFVVATRRTMGALATAERDLVEIGGAGQP